MAWSSRLTPLLMLVWLPTATASGQQATDPGSGSFIDARARKVLQKLSDHYRACNFLSATVSVELQLSVPGQEEPLDIAVGYEFSFARSDAYALRTTTELTGIDVVSDGEQLVTYVPVLRAYTIDRAPKSLALLPENPNTSFALTTSPSGGMEATVLLALTSDDPYRALLGSSAHVLYHGFDEQRQLHQIRLIESMGTVDVWITDSSQPWLVQVTPSLRQIDRAEVDSTIRISQWSSAPVSSDRLFWRPPVEARQIASFRARFEPTSKLDDQLDPSAILDLQ